MTTVATEVNKLMNRHMARLLTELTESGCPVIFIEHIKSRLSWLRSDLQVATGAKEPNEYQTNERCVEVGR